MNFDDFEPKYISLRPEGDVVVVALKHTQLTDEDNIDVMGFELSTLVDQHGCRKVILDLDGVEHVSSAVIGKFITLHRRLHRHEGRLVLCQLEDSLREVLNGCRLLDYFSTADDLDAARAMLV